MISGKKISDNKKSAKKISAKMKSAKMTSAKISKTLAMLAFFLATLMTTSALMPMNVTANNTYLTTTGTQANSASRVSTNVTPTNVTPANVTQFNTTTPPAVTATRLTNTINATVGDDLRNRNLISVTVRISPNYNDFRQNTTAVVYRWWNETNRTWHDGGRSTGWVTAAGGYLVNTGTARFPFRNVGTANRGYYRLYVYLDFNNNGRLDRTLGRVSDWVRLNVSTRYDNRWWDGNRYTYRWWDGTRWRYDSRWRDDRSWVSPGTRPGGGLPAAQNRPAAPTLVSDPPPARPPVTTGPSGVGTFVPSFPTAVPGLYNPFVDVSVVDWFFNYAVNAYHSRLMVGTDTEPMTFSPHMTLTRGMIVTILHNLEQNPQMGGLVNPFMDVNPAAWYAAPVLWAAANGVVAGSGDGNFRPNDYITLQDLTVILNNYAQLRDWSLPSRGLINGGLLINSSYYAQEAITRFTMAGVIDGVLADNFYAVRYATRAETAALFLRFRDARVM